MSNQNRELIQVYEAPIDKRGAVVIPEALRTHMGVQPGDKILFQVYDDVVKIKSERPLTLEEVFRSVPPKQSDQNLVQIIRDAKDQHSTDRLNRKFQP